MTIDDSDMNCLSSLFFRDERYITNVLWKSQRSGFQYNLRKKSDPNIRHVALFAENIIVLLSM